MAETSLSSTPVFSARPTLRVAGQADERMTELLTAMRMEESEGGQSALELHLSNWVSTRQGQGELGFGADSSLRLGAQLAVYAGEEADPTEIFQGQVSALELVWRHGATPTLVVLAEDALAKARSARRSRVFSDCSPAEVLRQVAAALGLSVQLQGLDSPLGTWVQLDETDLGFLRRLFARFDADLQVVGQTLHACPRADMQRGSVELQMHGQLSQIRIGADLSGQITSVSIAGWDAGLGDAVQGQADTLRHAGPGQGRSGPAWAADVLGDRPEHLATPAVATAVEALAVAQAAFDRRARRFVRAHGIAEGNPRLRVGCSVRLMGISEQFDNTYQVVQAFHLFDQQAGYRTEFKAECAFLGP